MTSYILPVQQTRMSQNADKSYTIAYRSQSELTRDEAIALLDCQRAEGFLLFSFTPPDVETLKNMPDAAELKSRKSRSAQLRAVIYRHWQQFGSNEDAEHYYCRKMDGLIELFKEDLD